MDVLKQYISYQLKYIQIQVVNIYTPIYKITPINIDMTWLICSSSLPNIEPPRLPHTDITTARPKTSRSNFSSLDHEDYTLERVALSQYVRLSLTH